MNWGLALYGFGTHVIQKTLNYRVTASRVRALQNKDEFIAAVTKEQVCGAQFRRYALNKTDQNFIASRMTIFIVHLLEVIEVEKRKRKAVVIQTGA